MAVLTGLHIRSRSWTFVFVLFGVCQRVTAASGAVNYSMGATALHEMTQWVVLMMGYVIALLYAVASLLAIYNATVIYVKLQHGEEGFVKSVLTLVGAIIFLMGCTIVLPGFFGFQYNGISTEGFVVHFGTPF